MTRSSSTTDARCCSSTKKYPRRSRTPRSTSRSTPPALVSWSGDSRTTRPPAIQEGGHMSTLLLFVAMLAPAIFVAAALAQTQLPPPAERSSPPSGATTPAPEAGNAVEGRIENIDPSRTAITLSDGTKLVTPAGAVLKPGVVTEGMLVVASYREENGAKGLTGRTGKDRGPSHSLKRHRGAREP